jgi:hypothetical protein
VVFSVQTVWVAIVGLFGVVALPIINKENFHHQDTVKTEKHRDFD